MRQSLSEMCPLATIAPLLRASFTLHFLAERREPVSATSMPATAARRRVQSFSVTSEPPRTATSDCCVRSKHVPVTTTRAFARASSADWPLFTKRPPVTVAVAACTCSPASPALATSHSRTCAVAFPSMDTALCSPPRTRTRSSSAYALLSMITPYSVGASTRTSEAKRCVSFPVATMPTRPPWMRQRRACTTAPRCATRPPSLKTSPSSSTPASSTLTSPVSTALWARVVLSETSVSSSNGPVYSPAASRTWSPGWAVASATRSSALSATRFASGTETTGGGTAASDVVKRARSHGDSGSFSSLANTLAS